jgi:hypothetical protein
MLHALDIINSEGTIFYIKLPLKDIIGKNCTTFFTVSLLGKVHQHIPYFPYIPKAQSPLRP